MKCACVSCPYSIVPDKYHPGRVKYCSAACRRHHRNRVFGSHDREQWKQKHPDDYQAAMDRRRLKEQTDPETQKIRARASKNSKCKRQYGITIEQKEQRIAAQEHKCANPGCRTTYPGKKGWATDHDHDTGELRGELCQCCNVALGMAHDSVKVLEGLVRYQKSYE